MKHVINSIGKELVRTFTENRNTAYLDIVVEVQMVIYNIFME